MRKSLFFLFTCVLNASCQMTEVQETQDKKTSVEPAQHFIEEEETAPVPKPPEVIKVQNLSISPGQVISLRYSSSELANKKLECDGLKIDYYLENKNSLIAYVPVDYFSKARVFHCNLIGKYRIKIAEIKVVYKKYPAEKLNVNKKRVVLSKVDQKRVNGEQKVLNRIYKSSESIPQFQRPFISPLKSKITSHYGTRRIFNNHAKTQHLGTDFRAAIGTPIPTSNDGKVVFAGDLFYTGNTVIVDHGLGLFTMYGHLSKLKTKKGDIVKRGSIVGLSGATGRVNGPHLHWGVKVLNHWVDGFTLIKASESSKIAAI